MSTLSSAFSFSVGRKLIMALTGLFLITFLLEHLIGNMLMFSGPEAFNGYANFMGHNVFIRIAEVVLFLGFITHIYEALVLRGQNNKARPSRYAVNRAGENSSWFSRNMVMTGVILLVFLVLHLTSFFLQARFGADVSLVDSNLYPAEISMVDGEHFSLYHKVAAHFFIEWYAILYVVAMAIVGFHLWHGFQSAFQTLGVNHPKYTPIIKVVGRVYAIVIPLGFASIPIYFQVVKHFCS